MGYYKEHGWRGDEYTLIRGDLHASVSRAWCADTESNSAWRWSLYDIDASGCVETREIPDGVKHHGFATKGAAMLACEEYMTSLADEAMYLRAARFEGLEPVEVPL